MKPSDSATPKSDDKSPSTPTSTDTKIEETKKPTSKDELNVLATDSDDIITKILFELKYGKNFSGTANLKKINEATTALKTLLTSEKNKADTQRELQSQLVSEHYWIRYYGEQRKYLDGSDGDMPQINELKRHQQLHKDKLADLTSQLNSLQGADHDI